MNKNLFTPLFVILTILCSACSDDSGNGSYNPYDKQIKTDFYPTTIEIGKKHDKRTISENWGITYSGDNKEKVEYTHKIVDQYLGDEKSTTTEEENATLHYFANSNQIINKITYKKSYEDKNITTYYTEDITEFATIKNGVIETIDRNTIRTTGDKVENLSYRWSFEYSDGRCVASIYQDLNNTENRVSRNYKWNKKHQISEITVESNEDGMRTNSSYKYGYGELSKDYGFQINAFIFDNYPHIYAALGLFGKTTPYKIIDETQMFKEWKDGKWHEDLKSDNKTYDLRDYSEKVNVIVDSDIYDTHYYINFK